MLMGSDDGGIDDQVLKVWILNQHIENTLPNALLGPLAKAPEYAVPVAELSRQIAPRCACASQPNNCIDE